MAKKPKKKKAQSPTNLALQRPNPNAVADNINSNPPVSSKPIDEVAVEVDSNPAQSPPIPQEEPPAPVPQVEPPPQPAPPPKPKPLPAPEPENKIETVSNAEGEAFSTGDKIVVTAPWGEKAIAQITNLYQSPSATWAQYQPAVEELPTGWSWLGGVCRAESLMKVE